MELHSIATCSSLTALGYSARGQVEERKREIESGRDDGQSTKGRREQERREQGRIGNLPLEGREDRGLRVEGEGWLKRKGRGDRERTCTRMEEREKKGWTVRRMGNEIR